MRIFILSSLLIQITTSFAQVPTLADDMFHDLGVLKVNDFRSYNLNILKHPIVSNKPIKSIEITITKRDTTIINTISLNSNGHIKNINSYDFLSKSVKQKHFKYFDGKIQSEITISGKDTSKFDYQYLTDDRISDSLNFTNSNIWIYGYENDTLTTEILHFIGSPPTIRKYFYQNQTLNKTVNTTSFNEKITHYKFVKNKIAESISFSLNNSDTVSTDKVNFEYNGNNDLIKEYKSSSSEYLNATVVYDYDKKNRLVGKTIYDVNDTAVLSETYHYKKSNLYKKISTMNIGGVPKTEIELFKYLK